MSAIGAVGAVGAMPPISPSLLTFASPAQLDALARIAATPNVTAQQLALALGVDPMLLAGQVDAHLSVLRRVLLSAGFQVPAPASVEGAAAGLTGDAGGAPAQAALPGQAGAAGGGPPPPPPGTAAVAPPPQHPAASHVPTPAIGDPTIGGPAVGPVGGPVVGAPGVAPDGSTTSPAVLPTTAGPAAAADGTAAAAGGARPPVLSAYDRAARLAPSGAAAPAPAAPPALHAQGALQVGQGEPAVLLLVDQGSSTSGGGLVGHGLAPSVLAAGTPRGAVLVASLTASPSNAVVVPGGAPAAPGTAPAAAVAVDPAAGAQVAATSVTSASGSPAGAAGPSTSAPTAVPAGTPEGSAPAAPRTWSDVPRPFAPTRAATEIATAPAATQPTAVPLLQAAADPIGGLRSWALVDVAVPPLPAAEVEQVARQAAPSAPPVTLNLGSGPAGEVEAGDVLARATSRPVDVVADARTAAAALEMALRDPSKVRRLVLDLSGFFVGGAAGAAAADKLLMAGAVGATDPGRLAELLAAAGTWGAPREERRSRRSPDRGGGRKNLAEHLFAALFSLRIADQLEDLEVPITIIGPEDEAVQRLLHRAAELLAEAEVIASSRPEVVVLEIIRAS